MRNKTYDRVGMVSIVLGCFAVTWATGYDFPHGWAMTMGIAAIAIGVVFTWEADR
jgi:hypothetical protein